MLFRYPKRDLQVLDNLAEHLQGQDRYPTLFEALASFQKRGAGPFLAPALVKGVLVG